MKKRTLSRNVLTLALGMSLAAAGAFAAFADPLGLSYINGQTVTSRMGGFEFSAPAEYKVDRSGASSALSGEIVAGLVEDSGKIDFGGVHGRMKPIKVISSIQPWSCLQMMVPDSLLA